MSSFDDVRLPIDIERGAKGGLGFKTTVVPLDSGFEKRNQEWQKVRGEWNIGYGISTALDFEPVRNFHLARRGKAFGFRFRDWIDYKLTDELIGVGDGVVTAFQAVKTYPDDIRPFVRQIKKLTTDISQVIKVNGVVVSGTIDNSTGLVTPTVVPANTFEVRLTSYFDVPVRFDTDKLDVDIDWEDAMSAVDIPIVELKQ